MPYYLHAQEKMSVSEFYMDENDLTANQEGTIILDQNGNKCALIKIKTTEKGFSFDNGSLGIPKVDENPTAEIWVYLPSGSRRLTIAHSELGQISYEFQTPIKSARTYIMNLTCDRVFTATFDDKHQQTLILNITPKIAVVTINGVQEHVFNGQLNKTFSYGRYRYLVRAERYHDLEDTITINDSKPQIRNIQLKKAYGWLQISNYPDLNDAKLYIDNALVGNISDEPVDVNSGFHTMRIVKPLYETFEKEFTISDDSTLNLEANLVANFGTVTLTANDSEDCIYIDNDFVGKGTYTGDVGVGNHIVECRREYYRSTSQDISVVKGDKTSYTLKAPTPIFTSVKLSTSSPAGMRVSIDGGEESKTTSEYFNNKVLIGPHNITISQKGYRTQNLTVDLREEEAYSNDIAMQAVVKVSFESHPTEVYLKVDGEDMGTTPKSLELSTGDHRIVMAKSGYTPYEGVNNFKKDEMVFSKRLLRIYYNKKEAYIEGGFQAPSLMAWYAALGYYVGTFNMEGFYMGGIQKSEPVSFNPTSSSNTYYSNKYFSCELKPTAFIGGKIGFGIKFGGKLRITPQVGCGVLLTDIVDNSVQNASGENSSYVNNIRTSSESKEEIASTYAISAIGDIKFQLALVKGVSLVVTPSYSFVVKKNALYESLSNISTKIKSWAEGFNCSAGLNFYF